jgi:hypothetical protein
MIALSMTSSSVEPVHRSTPRPPISTLQHQRMAYLSSLSYLSDWPIDIIQIVADYMSIQLWIAFEEYTASQSTLMVLNLTSLQTDMRNNTFKYIGVPLTSDSSDGKNQQPLLRKGASPTLVSSLNLAENDGIDGIMTTTTSEWHRWISKRSNRGGGSQTYAIIDNLLVS